MSSPARLPLVVEVLCTADAAYGLIADIHQLAVDGRKEDALHTLAVLADAVAAHRPLLRGVLLAERQAAEARDLSQRADVKVICSIGIPKPQPDAANAETQSPSPQQPSPSVA